MAALPLNWFRISFHESRMTFDSPKTPTTLPVTLCSALFKSGMDALLEDHKDLAEILKNMEASTIIEHLPLTADSPFFGSDIIRCAYIFPSEVFIPTRHDLSVGMIRRIKENGMVKHGEITYIADVELKIGISKINPEDVKTLQAVSPRRFIGFMDDDLMIKSE